jgi:tripartite-type tricarboxylate transporter receptor subunit TctC
VAIDHLKSGRLRALAVTSAKRWQGLPDVPTVGDVLPGYEVTSWFGIGAPKSTPAQIVDKLNQAINAGLADAKLNARLAELGVTAMIVSPADFVKLIAEEDEKWGHVIRAANIKPD